MRWIWVAMTLVAGCGADAEGPPDVDFQTQVLGTPSGFVECDGRCALDGDVGPLLPDLHVVLAADPDCYLETAWLPGSRSFVWQATCERSALEWDVIIRQGTATYVSDSSTSFAGSCQQLRYRRGSGLEQAAVCTVRWEAVD